jgi:Domain of unknown function (DUF4124)
MEEGPVKIVYAFVLTLAVLPAQAQMLKCIGKDGKVEYAAQCPPGTKPQDTGIRNDPAKAAPAAAPQQKSVAERDADFKKRQTEGAEARQKEEAKAKEVAAKREDCDRAQVYLKSLQDGQRIAAVDPKTGERVFVDDASRPAEIAKAQRTVDSNCK